MAGFFQQVAKGFSETFFGNPFLRDYTHASKTFRSNAYQYSPKYKFLFHVYFELNSQYIAGLDTIFGNDNNLGLLVKSIQLPKFTFDTHDMNQYNRKRIVQTKIKYDPIQVTFHDDNGNLARQLWYSYYSYYYKDPSQVFSGAATRSNYGDFGEAPNNAAIKSSDINARNLYDASLTENNDWGYIGEAVNPQTATGASVGTTKVPFFKTINIYGFNQHNFVLYTLINPIIESFNHDTYNYAEGGGVMENQMTLKYETVKYYDGAIDGRAPGNIVKDFASNQYYDRTISPIARPGGIANILGQGGLVDAAGGIIQDLNSVPPNLLGALQKAGTSYNTFKNVNLKQAIKSEITQGLVNQVAQTPNRSSPFTFPSFGSTPSNIGTAGARGPGITTPPTVNQTGTGPLGP
jgi:hypothetical protein